MLKIKKSIDILIRDSYDFIISLHNEKEFSRRYEVIKEENMKKFNKKNLESKENFKNNENFKNEIIKQVTSTKKNIKLKKEIFPRNQILTKETEYLKPKYQVNIFKLIFKE